MILCDLDLPQLELIKVGDNSMNGTKKDDCSLIMKGSICCNLSLIDLPSLKTVISNKPGNTFYSQKLVILSSDFHELCLFADIPNVEKVELPNAFTRVTSCSVESKSF